MVPQCEVAFFGVRCLVLEFYQRQSSNASGAHAAGYGTARWIRYESAVWTVKFGSALEEAVWRQHSK